MCDCVCEGELAANSSKELIRLCPKSWGSAGGSGKLGGRRGLPSERGGQREALLKVTPEQKCGGREMVVQGDVQDPNEKLQRQGWLRARLRGLLGYVYAKAEEAFLKERR